MKGTSRLLSPVLLLAASAAIASKESTVGLIGAAGGIATASRDGYTCTTHFLHANADRLECWGYSNCRGAHQGDNQLPQYPMKAASASGIVLQSNDDEDRIIYLHTGEFGLCVIHGEESTLYCFAFCQDDPAAVWNVSPNGLHSVNAVTSAMTDFCALIEADDGATQVHCWGGSYGGANPELSQPKENLPTTLTQIDAGYGMNKPWGHFCAVASDTGTVHCWGPECDLPSSEPHLARRPCRSSQQSAPAAQVATGRAHTCIILRDSHTVECWGVDNEFGQLNVPAELNDGLRVLSIAASIDYTCAIVYVDDENDVAQPLYCWGTMDIVEDEDEAKSYLVNASRLVPVVELQGQAVRGLTAGPKHACVILEDSRKPVCFGSNGAGESFPIPDSAQGIGESLGSSLTIDLTTPNQQTTWDDKKDDGSLAWTPRRSFWGLVSWLASGMVLLLDC